MIWSARFLSFFMGFLSLSQEILWVRLAGFTYHGAPQAFGGILGLYLLGIALGAALGKRFCTGERNLYHVTGIILFTAAVLDVALPWLTIAAFDLGRVAGTAMLTVGVLMTALLKSMVFPIAHHLGSSSQVDKVGSSVSKVYFANIVGSTLGPMVTGFLLLQVFTLQQSFMLMSGITLLIAAYCWSISGVRRSGIIIAGSVLSTTLLMLTPEAMIGKLAENTGNREGPFKTAIENRYGIIHVLSSANGDDYIFGGNVYDGRVNVDFMQDSNEISRVQVLAALQPRPKRVLVIGMSAGAWTRALGTFPGVENIDVVEINPGYVELTEKYDLLKPILSDSRIKLHFDDGRRWLKRHPGEKYDLIVMNTTFYYRAYSTLLISKDFLEVVKQHLTPDGLVAFNSTGLWDIFKTASTVFPDVYRYRNFVIAGGNIVVPSEEESIRRVGALDADGEKVVDIHDPVVLDKLRYDLKRFVRYEEDEFEKLAQRPLEVITDQNMISEYKYGKSILTYLNKKR